MDSKKELAVSYAPHLRSPRSTSSLMLDVILALVPALIAGAYFFGILALVHVAVCVIFCVGFEYVWGRLFKTPSTIADLSAVVTGILLAFNLPVGAPVWVGIVGAAFAIIVVKMFFGGLGGNFVNPALAARAFLFACWPVAMTTWAWPQKNFFSWAITPLTSASGAGAEAMSGATPLAAKAGEYSFFDLFLGNIPGSIGEISAIALLIGFLYLLLRGVISYRIPVFYVLTVYVLSVLLGKDGLYAILSGGLMLGAIFMATDYTTSPVSSGGQIIFALGLGVITVMIRVFGGYPEGVSYSILLMNIVTPLIDKTFVRKKYGEVARHEKK